MRSLSIFLLLLTTSPLYAQSRAQTRVLVKMTTGSCAQPRGFMAAMSGLPPGTQLECAEYTLVASKVVFVMNPRRCNEFLPLAEDLTFVIHKNEVVIFDEDERREHRFIIRQMLLRSEWDRQQAFLEAHREIVAQQVRDPHLAPRGYVVFDGR